MKANICFYCKKAVGKCSWSAVNMDTLEVRYELVPGCVVKPSIKMNGKTPVKTYHITSCPQFDPDEDCKKSCKICGAPLSIDSGRISYCEECAPPGDKYHAASNALQRKLKRMRK